MDKLDNVQSVTHLVVGFGDNVPFFGTVRIPLPEAFLAEWYEFQGIGFKVLTLPIRR